MLALDPSTGKIKWGYQYTPNDGWDYDGMATPILIDTTIDGKPTKAAVVANRNGFFYAIDRSDGRFLYAMPLVEGINWTTGLDPKTGKPTINEAMKPLATGKTVEKIIPGLEGGTNWFPPAYDPSSGVLFVAVNQWGMGLTSWEKGNCNISPATNIKASTIRCTGWETRGDLKAIEVANKKVLWDVPSPLPLFSGILATKGCVVFTGDQRGRLLAYNSKTGKELWRFQTGSAINASPITYELDGKQYVAIFRARRRPKLLLFSAEGRDAVGVRDRRQGR